MEICKPSYLSTKNEGFDTQLGHHISDTTVTAIIIHDKPNSSPLNRFELINEDVSVWVPERDTILQN